MTGFREKWSVIKSSPRTKYYLVTAVFILFLFFLSDNNIIRWISVEADISRQEAEILQYKKSIEDMKRRYEMLNSNLDTLETFARENYYFHLPDEEIFLSTNQ